MSISVTEQPTTHLDGDSLVGNRQIAYEALFLGELPYEPQPNESDIGLSGLWRAYTAKSGGRVYELNQLLDQLPTTVETILRDHELHSRGPAGDDSEAAFSLLNPSETMPMVVDITSRALTFWEKALWRNRQASILMSSNHEQADSVQSTCKGSETISQTYLDNERDERLAHLAGAKSIVVETAAAVIQVLPIFAKNPNKPSSTEKKNLARVLANWGPQFLTEWMDGKIIQGWLDGQPDLSKDERQEWLNVFTPGLRKQFAAGNIRDPLAALEKVKDNLELLTNDCIAERLSWTVQDVIEVLTPGLRKHFAVSNISDPLAGLERVKDNLKLLTDDVISERLGWAVQDVAEVFTPGLRKQFAVNNIRDPLAALEKVKDNLELLTDDGIALRLGWAVQDVAEVFTPSLRKYFAVGNISNPLAGLEKVKDNLELLTDDVISERLGWTTQEVVDVFTPSLRKRFAVGNISNPLAGLEKVKDNLDLLTDDRIAERLGWAAQEAVEIFTPAMRKYFAVHSIGNPLAGLEKVKDNLELLTDDVIAEQLGWEIQEVADVFTSGLRKHFAVNNIGNPLAAVIDYIKGKISISGRRYTPKK